MAHVSKPLVIITGASSGIGMATAQKMSQEGYPLLLLARRVEKMEALQLPHALCRRVDITQAEDVRSAIKEAEAIYGPTDALINNAGVMLLGRIEEQDPLEWERMMELNVMALLRVTRDVLPSMKKRGQGTIINVSSVAGKRGFADHAVYCGSKFAVHGISETLRSELAPNNIRVSVISPGVVETELLMHTSSQSIKESYREFKKAISGGIHAENVADAICFIYQQPQSVCIREIELAPLAQLK